MDKYMVLNYAGVSMLSDDKIEKGLIDMHIHTCYSDGDYKPKEIVRKVKAAGVDTFAITDHDTVLGCKELNEFKDSEILYIPGVELTAFVPKGRMHILGYNFDIYNSNLNKLLDNKKSNSIKAIDYMYQYLNKKYGINIPSEEFDLLYKKIGNIGRPDLAILLTKYNYVGSIDEAFKKYLIEAYDATRINRITTSKEECISALKDAGAYISLAHPLSLKMNYEELKTELIYLKSLGLSAIEICHSEQPEEYRKILKILKDELNLYETGGSDYHGPTVKPNIEIGTGRDNNIKIKELSLINLIRS